MQKGCLVNATQKILVTLHKLKTVCAPRANKK